jgi:hypothetical protein
MTICRHLKLSLYEFFDVQYSMTYQCCSVTFFKYFVQSLGALFFVFHGAVIMMTFIVKVYILLCCIIQDICTRKLLPKVLNFFSRYSEGFLAYNRFSVMSSAPLKKLSPLKNKCQKA